MESTTEKAISIEVLNLRENSLIALAASAKDLTITGPEDKDGYKAVKAKRIELKAERVSVENDAYDLRENAIKFQKTVIKREKQLVAIISEEENRLSGLEDTYDQWQEEIKRKKDKEENERIQKRVDALSKFGYAIDFYEAKIMEEENFQALLGEAEASYIKEQERIANEKAEADRLKKEEEERLRIEREELARQRAEQNKRDQELLARGKELQRQEAERLEAIRKQEEAIRKEQEAKEAQIRAEREKFEEEKRKHEEAVRLENARKEAAERAVIEEQNRIKREAEDKEKREQKAKEEQARQEALRPDKEKLKALSQKLFEFPLPEVADSASKDLIMGVRKKLDEISTFIKTQSEKL